MKSSDTGMSLTPLRVIAFARNLSTRELIRSQVDSVGAVLISPRDVAMARENKEQVFYGAAVIVDVAECASLDDAYLLVIEAREGSAAAVYGFFPHVRKDIEVYFTEKALSPGKPLFDILCPRSRFFPECGRALRALCMPSPEASFTIQGRDGASEDPNS